MTATPQDTTPAITGLGCVSPFGSGLEAQVRAMTEDRVALGPFKTMEQAQAVAQEGLCGGECSSLDDQPLHERAARGLAIAVREALDDAGFDLDAPPYPPGRIAAVFGTSLHGMNAAGVWLRSASERVFEYFQAGHVLSHALKGLPVGGARMTCSSACASSLSSLAHTRALLESGVADLVICGGYDPVTEYAVSGFHSLQVVSLDRLRPFASDRRGMQVSEGYGVFVIERAADAERRNATIHALVAGMGESSDGHHLTKPHPEGAGAAAVLEDALADSGLEPEAVGLIIAHATGTRDNDAAEAKAYAQVFGSPTPPVAALKSRIGHTLGAAGALETIISRACLDHSLIPSTANVTEQQIGEPINLALGPPRRTDRPPPHAVSCSFGFGGANVALIQTTPKHRGDLRQDHRLNRYRVGITGVGTALPGAIGPGLPGTESLWRTGTLDADAVKSQLPRAKSRRLSPLAQSAILATRFALEHAKIDPAQLPGLGAPVRNRPACMVASCNGSGSYAYDYYSALVEEGYKAANPLMFAEGVPNAPAAHISMAFGIHGPSQSIIGTHTCGIDALSLAVQRIATGRWTTTIVCAVEQDHTLVRSISRGCGQIEADAPACEGAITLILQRLEPGVSAIAELHSPAHLSTESPERAIAALYNDAGPPPLFCPTDRRMDRSLRSAGHNPLPHAPWFGLGGGLTVLHALDTQGNDHRRVVAGCPTGLVSCISVADIASDL